jgi:threonine synthase
VVSVVTGNGLKDPEVLKTNFDSYPVINLSISELKRAIAD